MQGIFQKENTDKALKYGIYRHLPTYEKIIRNLVSFYDENSVNIFYDGPFRMNVPGVKFNNRNWPHIVRTLRLSLCLCMILFPIINIVAGSIVADVWENIGKYVFLAMFLCGVLLPIYVVGKKYE